MNISDKECLISEAILNDKILHKLHRKRANTYAKVPPTINVRNNDGEYTFWVDEKNHPILSKLNEMIEQRIETIKQFYK